MMLNTIITASDADAASELAPCSDDERAADNDLRRIAGFSNLWWPKSSLGGPKWVELPKQVVIRRICAAVRKVPLMQVTAKRIVPSHPSFTDYDIRFFQKQDRQRLVFRVYLPVVPRMQTLSVVATMRYVKEHTSLNVEVPEVVSFCADATKTELDFEYVLMKFPPGVSIDEALPKSTQRQRKQLAYDVARMWRRCEEDQAFYFNKLGSIYQSDPDLGTVDSKSMSSFFIGYMLQPWFTQEKLAYMSRPGNEFGINAGPFDSAIDLQLAILDSNQKRITQGTGLWFGKDFEWFDNNLLEDKEDDLEGIQECLRDLELQKAQYTQTSFYLERGSHLGQDVLVDPKSLKITGLINWEGTATLPDFSRADIWVKGYDLFCCDWFYARDGLPRHIQFKERRQYKKELDAWFTEASERNQRLPKFDSEVLELWDSISGGVL